MKPSQSLPPNPMDPNRIAAVTLPLAAWNTVLGMIAKQPWDVADPLMQEIRRQLLQQPQAGFGEVVPFNSDEAG